MDNLEQLEKLFEEISEIYDEIDLSVVDQQDRGHLKKVSDFLIFVKTIIDSISSSLYPSGRHAPIINSLSTIKSHLSNFKVNNNSVELHNACNQIDTAVSNLVLLPTSHPKVSKQSFSRSAIAFEKQTLEILNNLEKQAKRARDGLQNAEEEAIKLNESIEEQKEKYSELDSKIDSLTENFKTEFDTLRNDTNTALSEKIGEHERVFSESNEAWNSDFSSAEEIRLKTFNEQLEQLRNEADTAILYLNEKKDEVAKLVGIVGNIGISGNFKVEADKAAKSAFWNYSAAIVTFVALICLSLYFTVLNPVALNDYSTMLLRLVAVGTIAWPLKYFIQQQQYFRDKEGRLREKEGNLCALPAFLEPLDEEKKKIEIVKYAEKYFDLSHASLPHSSSNQATEHPAESIIKSVITNKEAS